MNEEYIDKLYNSLYEQKWVTVDREKFASSLSDSAYVQKLHKALSEQKWVTVGYDEFANSLGTFKKKNNTDSTTTSENTGDTTPSQPQASQEVMEFATYGDSKYAENPNVEDQDQTSTQQPLDINALQARKAREVGALKEIEESSKYIEYLNNGGEEKDGVHISDAYQNIEREVKGLYPDLSPIEYNEDGNITNIDGLVEGIGRLAQSEQNRQLEEEAAILAEQSAYNAYGALSPFAKAGQQVVFATNSLFYDAASLIAGALQADEIEKGLSDFVEETNKHSLNLKMSSGISLDQIQKGAFQTMAEGDVANGFKLLGYQTAEAIPSMAMIIMAPELSVGRTGALQVGRAASQPLLAAEGNIYKQTLQNAAKTLGTRSNAGISILAGLEGRDSYEEAIESGLSQVEALAVATPKAMATYVFEHFFMGAEDMVRKSISEIGVEKTKQTLRQQMKSYVSEVGDQFIKEGLLEEGVPNLIGQIIDSIATGKEFNVYSWLDESAVGGLMGFGSVTASKVADNVGKLPSTLMTSLKLKKIGKELKTVDEELSKEETTQAEKEVLNKEKVRLNGLKEDVVKEIEYAIAPMSNFDKQQYIKINRDILKAQDDLKNMSNDKARELKEKEIEKLYGDKKALVEKYAQETPTTTTTETTTNDENVVTEFNRLDGRRVTYLDNSTNELIDGELVQDGQTLTVITDDGRVVEVKAELPNGQATSNINDIQENNISLEDIGIKEQQPYVTVNKDGTFTYNRPDNMRIEEGTKLVDRKGGLKAIRKNSKGELIGVELSREDGTTAPILKGQDAADAAYQIQLRELQTQEQEKRVSDEIRQEIEQEYANISAETTEATHQETEGNTQQDQVEQQQPVQQSETFTEREQAEEVNEPTKEEKVKQVSDNLKSAWEEWKQAQKNLGAAYNPKSQAEADVKLTKAIIKYLVAEGIYQIEKIKKAVKDALGVDITDEDAEFISNRVKAVKEEAKDMRDKSRKMFNRQEDKNLVESRRVKRANSWFSRKKWTDRQANIRKQLIKGGAMFAEAMMTAKAGARAFADKQYLKKEEEIYKDLELADEKILDEILFHERVIQIDSNRDEYGEKRPKHPDGFNKEKSQLALEGINQDIGEEKYNLLQERANMYFGTFNEMMSELYKNDLVTKETYEKFKDDKYIPRWFLHHLFDRSTVGNKNLASYGLRKDQIKTIEEGSEQDLFMDSRVLLNAGYRSLQNRIFTNKANLAIAEVLGDKSDIGFAKQANYKIGKDGKLRIEKKTGNKQVQEADQMYENIFYFKNGKRDAFQMPTELAEEWMDIQKNTDDSDRFLRAVLLTGLLKKFATGQNPLFFLANVPMDYVNVLMFTDNFDDKNLFSSAYSLGKSFSKMAKGISEEKLKAGTNPKVQKLIDEFVSHGGLMEFLTTYGKPDEIAERDAKTRRGKAFKSWGKGKKAVVNSLAFTGEVSEIAMRLAVFEKVKQRLTDELGGRSKISDKQYEDILYVAAAKARKTMDFAQGGLFTKRVDNMTPYFNAAMQGFRVAGSYIKNNPQKFAWKLAQMSVPIVGLMLYNMFVADDDDWDNVPDYEKNMYFIVFLPYKNEDGGRGYIRIRKNPQIAPFVNVIEWVAQESVGAAIDKDWESNEDRKKRAWESVNDALPFPLDPRAMPSKLPPSAQALITYMSNYDSFRDNEVSIDKGVLPEDMEGAWNENVPLIYKQFGKKTGLSPERTKASVEKMITTPSTNPMVGLSYSLLDNMINLTVDVPKEERSRYVEGMDMLKNMGRKVYRETNPNYSKFMNDKSNDIKKIQELERRKVKEGIKAIYESNPDAKANDFKDFVKENSGSKEEYRSFMNYAEDLVKRSKYKGTMPHYYDYLDIKYTRNPEAQAQLYGYYMGYPEIGSDVMKESLSDLRKIGFKPSSRFKSEYKKVLEEVKDKQK